jgi:hypothetical protein
MSKITISATLNEDTGAIDIDVCELKQSPNEAFNQFCNQLENCLLIAARAARFKLEPGRSVHHGSVRVQ